MAADFITDMDKNSEYLSDESRFRGSAESLIFPESREEFINAVKSSDKICIQGSRTGLCAAAVSTGGKIVNLKRLDRILKLRYENGNYLLTAEPGISIGRLNEAISGKRFDTSSWDSESIETLKKFKTEKSEYFFPPNPTEGSASLGGMFSLNAKGPDFIHYGKTSDSIEGVELCLPDGRVWSIKRGLYRFENGICRLPDGRVLEASSSSQGILNPAEGSDLLELFAGSEGMLAAVLSLTLMLKPRYKYHWGIMLFADKLSSALKLGRDIEKLQCENAFLTALEILDEESLNIINQQRGKIALLQNVPEFPAGAGSALHLQLESDSEEELEEALMQVMEIFERSGADDSFTWAGIYDRDVEMFASLSHSAAEAVNLISSGDTWRTALDLILPEDREESFIGLYRSEISSAGLHAAIFGNMAGGRLHIEFIPKNADEFSAARHLIKALTSEAAALGGAAALENGAGKIKKDLLEFIPSDLKTADYIKNFFDPGSKLNSGNYL